MWCTIPITSFFKYQSLRLDEFKTSGSFSTSTFISNKSNFLEHLTCEYQNETAKFYNLFYVISIVKYIFSILEHWSRKNALVENKTKQNKTKQKFDIDWNILYIFHVAKFHGTYIWKCKKTFRVLHLGWSMQTMEDWIFTE